jgi:hypothetical protein
VSPEQLQILRHALGTDDDGCGRSYRNHFVAGEGSTDFALCMALVESGHMARLSGNALTGGDDLFMVTDAGRAAAKGSPAVLTRAQRRYRAFLDADTGSTFREWLRLRWQPEQPT